MWQDQWERGHIAAGPANRFIWHYEPNFPIDRIANKRDALELFTSDREAWTEEGEPDRFDDMLNEPIREPIVLVDTGTIGYIWDGNHRVAASILTNRSTISAYVGIAKPIEKHRSTAWNQ